MYPPSIQKLINIFSKFPSIGPRTAARFVFYLIRAPKEETQDLLNSISNLNKNVKVCSFCFNLFEDERISRRSANETQLCPICRDNSRDKETICIVEKETDLISIEKTKRYKGIYFVLGGTVSKFKKQDIKRLRTEELKKRIQNPEKYGIGKTRFREIIIATNPTIEGEATALYLEKILKPLEIKITRIGRGLPVGGELEYADEETLSSSLENRR